MPLNVVLEKTPEQPMDSKEIKPVNLKGNQPLILIGRTDDEAPIPWPPDAKSQHIGKDPDAGKDGRQDDLVIKCKKIYKLLSINEFSLMQIADSLEKSLMLGKIGGRKRRGHERMRWLEDITDAMDMNLGKLREMVREERSGVLQSTGLQRVRYHWVTEQQEVQ